MHACSGCGAGCSAGCGQCSGCGAGQEMYLTQAECALLRQLAQIPFLPLARRADGETPVALGIEAPSEAILGLWRKGLVSLDYDLPLQNFDYSPYSGYQAHGSMALSARGQGVVELLEVQGITP